MTNEEVKAFLENRMRCHTERINVRVERMRNAAWLFADAVHEAKVKVDIDKILDETYALVGILQRGAEDITACGIRTGAYEEARTLLEN